MTKPNSIHLAPYGKCKRCKREALQSYLDAHSGYCYVCLHSEDRVLPEFTNGDEQGDLNHEHRRA